MFDDQFRPQVYQKRSTLSRFPVGCWGRLGMLFGVKTAHDQDLHWYSRSAIRGYSSCLRTITNILEERIVTDQWANRGGDFLGQ